MIWLFSLLIRVAKFQIKSSLSLKLSFDTLFESSNRYNENNISFIPSFYLSNFVNLPSVNITKESMRVVIQRVSHASVTIDKHCKSSIGKGMLILV